MSKLKLNPAELGESLRDALSELIVCNEIPAVFSPAGLSLFCRFGDETVICRTGNRVMITVRERVHFFRAVSVLCQMGQIGEGAVYREKCEFREFGILLDNSRNAVLKPETIEQMIRRMALMGYNQLLLYTEDTYRVENEPLFGYLRGAFSEQELRRIDGYCRRFGMELIPCIQTLAHLQPIFAWEEYRSVQDCLDILLTDCERTYVLIENMFSSMRKAVSSKRINIGMDEAFLLGRGKYCDEHGLKSAFEILSRHLRRVATLAEKYGFSPMMWSDMFWEEAQSFVKGEERRTDLLDFPKDLRLIYWDYYGTDSAYYRTQIAAHRQLGRELGFAAGAVKWRGFAPHNVLSERCVGASLGACIAEKVENVLITAWGDNGAECSVFAALPTFVLASDLAFGRKDHEEEFRRVAKFDRADALLPDLIDTLRGDEGDGRNPDKYLLYNQYFCGIFDKAVLPDCEELYADYAKRLRDAATRAGTFSYLFKTLAALCDVLSVKANLGNLTRAVYRTGDRAAMQALLKERYRRLPGLIKTFYRSFRRQWNLENKPFGFEVHQVRIGGLLLQTEDAVRRIEAYLRGDVTEIPELKEDLIDVFHTENKTLTTMYNYAQFTANVLI